MMREQIILELQMLTGIVSNDIKYLYNELVNVSKQQDKEETTVEFLNDVTDGQVKEINLDSWFKEL